MTIVLNTDRKSVKIDQYRSYRSSPVSAGFDTESSRLVLDLTGLIDDISSYTACTPTARSTPTLTWTLHAMQLQPWPNEISYVQHIFISDGRTYVSVSLAASCALGAPDADTATTDRCQCG
jgi:hypothetical protein